MVIFYAMCNPKFFFIYRFIYFPSLPYVAYTGIIFILQEKKLRRKC